MKRIKWGWVYKHNQLGYPEEIRIPLWVTPTKGFRKKSQRNRTVSRVRKVINHLRYGWKKI